MSDNGKSYALYIDTVYVRGSDGLANAVANFKQGSWADLAVYAFEHRQEVMRLVA